MPIQWHRWCRFQPHATHPALRSLKRPKPVPAKGPDESSPTESRSATPDQPEGKEQEMDGTESRPVAAKYERQMWFYLLHQPKGKGRVSSRWMPQHYFSVEQLSSPKMQDLRAEHVSTLSPERVQQVAALRVLGEQ